MPILIVFFFILRYLEANVTISQGWREGLSDLPDNLHHRPLYLIRHMRQITAKAFDIASDMITLMNGDTYQVKSTTSNKVYEVTFGDQENMPSCQCREFQKTHLICKHFAAIFHHCNRDWFSLPVFYRENPLFSVDDDCICQAPKMDDIVPETLDNNIAPTVNTTIIHETDQEINGHSIGQKPTEETSSSYDSQRRRLAIKVREASSRISTLSYLCPSVDTLKTCEEKLREISNKIERVCPTNDGMILGKQIEKKVQKRHKYHGLLKRLPLRRKRKIYKAKQKKHSAGKPRTRIQVNIEKETRNHCCRSDL